MDRTERWPNIDLDCLEALGWPNWRHVTVGPDGARWLAEPGSNSIVRLHDGDITEYELTRRLRVRPVLVI
jgi:hypothetical protein